MKATTIKLDGQLLHDIEATEPATPPEFGKVRLGIVVSNTTQNAILDSVVVVPLSTRPREIWPLRLRVRLPDGKESYAVIPGIRQVDKQRLGKIIGQASDATLASMNLALAAYLTDE